MLNVDTREVTRAGEEMHLTATQFELLRYLMENPKRVISKAQILDRVWDYDFGARRTSWNCTFLTSARSRRQPRSDDPHGARSRYVLKPRTDPCPHFPA
ncbi:hypothetical protein NicSoilC12_13810 [Arthrobacter sp. NicSoilC12]|nr:hypothetical protein NicSoilC12_13810 [Arthrobacter sp. NicSoilC12]